MGNVAFVSVLMLLIIVMVRQYPMSPRQNNSTLVLNLSMAEEPDSFSASSTFTPETRINYDMFSTLSLNITTETNGTQMERSKTKEVMILLLTVKEIVL
jgi:hypothetical protein